MRAYSAFQGLGPVVSLLCGLSASAAQAETQGASEKSASMQLFLDIVGDELSNTSDREMRVDLGGVPLVLGAGDGIDGAGLGMTAGVEGSYTVPLSSRIKLDGRTTLSKTRYISDTLFGAAQVASTSALRYDGGSLELALEPRFGVSFVDTAIDRTEYVVGGRVSKRLAGGWNLKASGSYAWRDSNSNAADSAETAEGRFGLSYEFGYGSRHPRLDLDYLFRRKFATAERNSTLLHTPSIAAVLPLSDWFELGATYCYDEATTYDFTEDNLDRRETDSHRLGMSADWYFGGEAAPGLDLKADYSYSRDTVETGSDDYEEHAGTVSLALSF